MKNTCIALAALINVLIGGMGSSNAQAPADRVVKLDPALDALISVDAKIEKVASGFGFTEGPVWVQRGREGYLLFTDIPGNKVHKMTSDGKVSVYEDQSGYRGPWNGWTMLTVGSATPNGPFIMVGADGLAVDTEGRLLLCAFGDRALERVEKDGKRTILADKYEGKRLNGPNDVVVKKDGTIYFSDTFGGLRNRADDPNKGLERNGFFMLRNGKLSMVVSDMKTVNGLALSPDEKYLYVNGGGDNYIRRYEIQPDGTLANPKLIIDLSIDKTPGATDGTRVDSKGNIWTTGPGGVWIISPEGKHLGSILMTERPANLGFGDADLKTLYLTARSSVYKVRVNTPGVPCPACATSARTH